MNRSNVPRNRGIWPATSIACALIVLALASLACGRGTRQSRESTLTTTPDEAPTVQATTVPSGGEATADPVMPTQKSPATVELTPTATITIDQPTNTPIATPTETPTPASDALIDEIEELLNQLETEHDAADDLGDLP